MYMYSKIVVGVDACPSMPVRYRYLDVPTVSTDHVLEAPDEGKIVVSLQSRATGSHRVHWGRLSQYGAAPCQGSSSFDAGCRTVSRPGSGRPWPGEAVSPIFAGRACHVEAVTQRNRLERIEIGRWCRDQYLLIATDLQPCAILF